MPRCLNQRLRISVDGAPLGRPNGRRGADCQTGSLCDCALATCSKTPRGSLPCRVHVPYDPSTRRSSNVYEGDELVTQAFSTGGAANSSTHGHPPGSFAVSGNSWHQGFITFSSVPITCGSDRAAAARRNGSPADSGGQRVHARHSITLSLAALNIFDPPARIIEPAIALSIVFIGASNHRPGRPRRPRVDRVCVRLRPRLRICRRAAGDGARKPRARLVAALLQPWGRNRTTAGRRHRRDCACRAADAQRSGRAAAGVRRIDWRDCRPQFCFLNASSPRRHGMRRELIIGMSSWGGLANARRAAAPARRRHIGLGQKAETTCRAGHAMRRQTSVLARRTASRSS